MLSSTTWSSKQQQHRRQGSLGSTAATTAASSSQQQQQPLPKLPGPKTTGYLQHHYQERQQQFQNHLQQQQPPQQQHPEEISINQTHNHNNNSNMNTTYQNNNASNNTASSMDVPLLSDLLKVVGGESPTVDKHLYTLLSGIVAAVEVTNERVVELSEQYQELSLEVATVSRVIHSNQLAASSSTSTAAFSSSHLDQDHHQQKQQKQQKMNINTTTPKRIGAVQSQRPTTPVTMAAAGGSTQNHHHQQHLATESVTALHTHAVADLENKIDNLAIRISKLQEEAGVRSKEAIEETYSEVLGLCEEERKKTNDQLQQMSRTIEGQMTVRLGELFSQGEMQLNEMVQDSFEKLKVCSEELTTSFSQTSKAFIENTSQSVSNCIKQATTACFEMISETRESAVFASHQSALASYETESKMLHLYKSFEQLVTSSSSSISAPVYHHHQQQQPPLPFRCCSAIEEVRALYNLFQIDATEALRIFKNCQSWFTSSNSNNNNNKNNNTSSFKNL